MTALTADEAIQASQATPPIYFEIKAAIRRAIREDENASLADEPATALHDLHAILTSAAEDVRELLDHSHQWNENDYCSICGADGRA
jgi:hypothetical protein